jgi:flagellar hook protein FlgE
MVDSINIAANGIRTSASQYAKSAEEVVKATTTGSDADLPKAIVDGKTSSYAFKANSAVLKTADKMMGALLDIMA